MCVVFDDVVVFYYENLVCVLDCVEIVVDDYMGMCVGV